jgi:hypothetical protein
MARLSNGFPARSHAIMLTLYLSMGKPEKFGSSVAIKAEQKLKESCRGAIIAGHEAISG